MSDNFRISTAEGERTIATDEISSIDFQRAKLIHGIDDINDGDVARTNPLPVQAYLESGTIHDGSRQMVPKFSLINVTSVGDATIVTAVANNKIRVLSYVVTGDKAGTFRWESPAGTPISGLMLMTVNTVGNGYVEASFNPLGHFETTSGGALVVEMATADDLQGHLTYVLVPD